MQLLNIRHGLINLTSGNCAASIRPHWQAKTFSVPCTRTNHICPRSVTWPGGAVQACQPKFRPAGVDTPQPASPNRKLSMATRQNLRPELVHMDLARGTNLSFSSEFQSPDASGPNRACVPRLLEQIIWTRALGHPEIATAEKGQDNCSGCNAGSGCVCM